MTVPTPRGLSAQPSAASSSIGPASWQRLWERIRPVSILVDLTIIVAVAFWFARPLLNFDDSIIPAGHDDWEDATASIELARESILDHGEFPLWNPYFRTGTPYLGEPITYVLNPVASVPALALGPFDGPKLAAALSMAVAGVGMYFLGAVLGMSRPMRVWCGLLMAMSGAFAGRVFAGHFNLIIGLAYVPWVFGLSLEALRRSSMMRPVLAALAITLLFFSGHPLQMLFVMPGLLVTFLLVAIGESWRDGRWLWDRLWPVALRGLAIAAWTLGFSAIQLFPALETQGYIEAPRHDLGGGQTVFASAENFFTADVTYLHSMLQERAWGWWEYYSYVGLVPLLGLAFVVPALLQPRQRFAVVWAAALFGFYLAWASAPHTFFKDIYDQYPTLYRFRVPSRALIFATPFLIALGGLGLDWLIDWLRGQRRWQVSIAARANAPPVRLGAGAVLAVAVIALAFYGLRDVFDSNRKAIATATRYDDRTSLLEWLRQRDDSVFFFAGGDLGQAPPVEFYEYGVKRLDAVWEYSFVPELPDPESGLPSQRLVITPKYFAGDPGAAYPGAQRIGEVDGRQVYRLPQSPFYASTLSSNDPPLDESYPWQDKTNEAQARIVSANVIEVRARPSPGDDRLLVLESYHSGWRLEIDGERAGKPDNFGGFLSTEALAGAHTYTFVFDPASFRYGAAITIGTILGAALLLGWRLAVRLRRPAAD